MDKIVSVIVERERFSEEGSFAEEIDAGGWADEVSPWFYDVPTVDEIGSTCDETYVAKNKH